MSIDVTVVRPATAIGQDGPVPDPTSSERPLILLAMNGDRLRDQLLPPRLSARLQAVGEVDLGTVVRSYDQLPVDQLERVQVIFGGWGVPKLDAAALDRMPRLQLVAYAAGSVRGFVTPETFARGVTVTTAAAANGVPVAEFTLALITLANKQILEAVRAYRANEPKSELFDSSGNVDRTVGIIGASVIGRDVLGRLESLQVRRLLADPTVDAAQAAALGAELVDLDTLIAESDVVSLHAPILPSTIGMIGAEQIAAMKDGATFINTARGVLVDHDALRAELATGRISAMLDVTDPEPLLPHDPMRSMPNVLLTPHLAGSHGLELRRMAESAVVEIERWATGEPPRFGVTEASLAVMA